MTYNSRLIFGVTILLSLIYKSAAINCFYCNSANDSACLDLKLYNSEMRGRMVPVVNCETAIPSPVAVNFFCRKIIQTIYHPNRESEVRVTRGCGWVRGDKPCYRADNSDHLETVCQCFDDHCNSAEHVNPATATGLFLILAAVLYFYR